MELSAMQRLIGHREEDVARTDFISGGFARRFAIASVTATAGLCLTARAMRSTG
jgi:hypothetical protein